MDQVLEKMGFGRSRIQWIWICLTTIEMLVIVNGSLSKPFKMERGLQQGDPLAPFLFVLVADILNRMLSKVVKEGLIEGITVGRQGVSLSHLQFTNDTIICTSKT